MPIIITTILTFLDNHYPDLEGDEARRGIWLVDVPLAQTHDLRSNINTGKRFTDEVLEKYDIPIVASALKLYLLELPGLSPILPIKLSTNQHRLPRFVSCLRDRQDYLQHHSYRRDGGNSCICLAVNSRSAAFG